MLGASLATLRQAQRREDGTELLLAIGLTARYAHNVDVEGAPEAGIDALTKAASRGGADQRPEWFLGTNLCSMGGADALRHFEAAEARGPAGSLPADYWADLLMCASMSGMPAHAIRAGRELERRGSAPRQPEPLWTMLSQARALLREPDPAAVIPFDDAWIATSRGEKRRVASTICGFEIELRPEWSPYLVEKGRCAIDGPVGSSSGKEGTATPTILVLGRVARKGESLDSFLSSLRFLEGAVAGESYPCPATACRSLEARRPEGREHGSEGFVNAVVFEREEPETRGLALERPRPLPIAPGGEVQVFRPMPRYVRFAGKIFYIVLLDSPQSAAESAKAEYRTFLREMVVE